MALSEFAGRLFVAIVVRVYCDLGLSTAGAFSQASLAAVQGASPLEVEEGEQHNGETNLDRDDHRPVWEVVSRLFDEPLFVVPLELATRLVVSLAARDQVEFVRALEHDLFSTIGILNVLGSDDFRHQLRLILPVVRPVIAQHQDLAVFRHLAHCDTQLDRVHLGPHVWHLRVLPLDVLVLQDARAGWVF